MKQIKILGVGEAVVDWVAEIPHFPKPDEKINAMSESHFAGGVTANYVVAVSRLNVSSGFIGAVGNDNYGNFLLNDFKDEKVDTSMTKIKEDKKTPVNFIFVTKGEKTIIQSPHMLKTKLEVEDLDADLISEAELIHTTLIHPEISKTVIDIAKDNDIPVSIDLESQIAERGLDNLKDMLLKADVLIPNKEGAKTITKTSNLKQAAINLIKFGIPKVIITLGDKGALITTEDRQTEVPAYEIEEVVDTTGAGDVFNGAFTVAYWIKNWDLEKSCKYANAAAALKIQKLGARTGMPHEKELLNFLKKNDDSFFQF
ncbi:MAG: carbohydrate kinase family protein [Promethearchaeia archaeon]